jgi:hypothetical protein
VNQAEEADEVHGEQECGCCTTSRGRALKKRATTIGRRAKREAKRLLQDQNRGEEPCGSVPSQSVENDGWQEENQQRPHQERHIGEAAPPIAPCPEKRPTENDSA